MHTKRSPAKLVYNDEATLKENSTFMKDNKSFGAGKMGTYSVHQTSTIASDDQAYQTYDPNLDATRASLPIHEVISEEASEGECPQNLKTLKQESITSRLSPQRDMNTP